MLQLLQKKIVKVQSLALKEFLKAQSMNFVEKVKNQSLILDKKQIPTVLESLSNCGALFVLFLSLCLACSFHPCVWFLESITKIRIADLEDLSSCGMIFGHLVRLRILEHSEAAVNPVKTSKGP